MSSTSILTRHRHLQVLFYIITEDHWLSGLHCCSPSHDSLDSLPLANLLQSNHTMAMSPSELHYKQIIVATCDQRQLVLTSEAHKTNSLHQARWVCDVISRIQDTSRWQEELARCAGSP